MSHALVVPNHLCSIPIPMAMQLPEVGRSRGLGLSPYVRCAIPEMVLYELCAPRVHRAPCTPFDGTPSRHVSVHRLCARCSIAHDDRSAHGQSEGTAAPPPPQTHTSTAGAWGQCPSLSHSRRVPFPTLSIWSHGCTLSGAESHVPTDQRAHSFWESIGLGASRGMSLPAAPAAQHACTTSLLMPLFALHCVPEEKAHLFLLEGPIPPQSLVSVTFSSMTPGSMSLVTLGLGPLFPLAAVGGWCVSKSRGVCSCGPLGPFSRAHPMCVPPMAR